MADRANIILALAVLALAPSSTPAKKVVMFPGLMNSYIIYHANIGQALVNLGHEVWICIPDYTADKGLIKHEAVKTILYGKHLGDMEATKFRETKMMDIFWSGDHHTFLDILPTVKIMKSFALEILLETAFVDRIKEIKPDLFILDAFMFTRNLLVLPYKLDLRFALIGTLHELALARVPYSPAVEPFFIQNVTNKMTFFERLESTFIAFLSIVYDIYTDDDIVTRFAPEKPFKRLNDIALQAEIFISESDHVLDYPRPMLPNTKRIGGSSVSEAKPLKGEFLTFVNAFDKGVVLVAFGSSDIDIPPHVVNKMVAAFEKLDLRVVWKANVTSPKPDKIMINNWVPQNDLLGHPKTKVFVSHCGKNGQYEALYHTVPMLCLPIYGDQYYNTQRISVKGLGLGADIRTITAQEFADLIKEVAYNPKYKTNIQKASTLFKELYKVPNKEAAYWFDHVMKYGGDYMRSSGQEMPLYQFFLLDIVAFFVGILFVLSFLVFLVVRFFYRRIKQYKIKAE